MLHELFTRSVLFKLRITDELGLILTRISRRAQMGSELSGFRSRSRVGPGLGNIWLGARRADYLNLHLNLVFGL